MSTFDPAAAQEHLDRGPVDKCDLAAVIARDIPHGASGLASFEALVRTGG